MGLTRGSVGIRAVDAGLHVKKRTPEDKIIAIAGNPNVGKSTVFNALTGMNQHTGNWPGKTVTGAQGYCSGGGHRYVLVDIPGTYSLMAHSAEEEVARDFICFGGADAVVVVCDATCLERNLNLVLQTMEISPRVLLCVNLMDEAARKEILIDLPGLSQALGVPVVGTSARRKGSLDALLEALDDLLEAPPRETASPVRYAPEIEAALEGLTPAVERCVRGALPARWLSLRLLEGDETLFRGTADFLGRDIREDPDVAEAQAEALTYLEAAGMAGEALEDGIVSGLVGRAEELCRDTVRFGRPDYSARDRRLDRLLTSRRTGYPVMLALLALVLWLTISGANVPSRLLWRLFSQGEEVLTALFQGWNTPAWLYGMLVPGAYRVLAWVVSVMLPPMAIFFPLFTLLEDAGYLPRVAFVLDHPFQRCSACGKQALTMCMGFGCNAAGVVGCRIIDSPRERLIAMLTNSLVPCNGRFPTLITLITLFFVGTAGGFLSSGLSALLLTSITLLGIGMTFALSKLLSRTLLRGIPSSFVLELPPYRPPQIGRVILRSIFDRTLFVLGRAAAVAAPAGLLLWMMANIQPDGVSLLRRGADLFDPFARLLGLDGVILMAFLLGFPANEIVLPIAVMAYLSQGTITDLTDLQSLGHVLTENGWTWVTAVCTMLFSLFHWPCSTTLLTIRRETGSWRWTALAFCLPTAAGMALCALVSAAARLLT